MARLEWDKTGERFYETGISNGVLYPQDTSGKYPKGVAWNGLISVTESPSGAEPSSLYADNIKYLTLTSVEEFGFSIEAYMYPDEFKECNGETTIATGVIVGQQKRKAFGMVYKSLIGNDVEGDSHGYKLHLVYGAIASPSEASHNSVNDNPEARTMSWECTTTPVSVKGFKPTSHLVVDSTLADPTNLKKLEDMLFGADMGDGPKLPLPDEVATLMKPVEEP